jgi:ribosomal protein L37AE/L43A
MTRNFNEIYTDNEDLDGYQIIETQWDDAGVCKRCGESFTKRYRKQIFCSRICASKYFSRVKDMKAKYGKSFTDWLSSEINYTYSPEEF